MTGSSRDGDECLQTRYMVPKYNGLWKQAGELKVGDQHEYSLLPPRGVSILKKLS
jgi:hypothetical protein